MRILEKTVDQGVVRWAKEKFPGIVVRKLSTLGAMGSSGDPDRLFLWKGKLLLIEMKAPGGKCTDLQLQRHAEWRAQGAKVVVVDSVSAGRLALQDQYAKRRNSHRTWLGVGGAGL